MSKLTALAVGAFIAAFGTIHPAAADTQAVLTGEILDTEGQPLFGVMVRLKDPETGVAETVYTDTDGTYRLPTGLNGNLEIRTRLPYFRDATAQVVVGDAGAMEQDFRMVPMSGDAEISDSLPGLFHFGEIPFDEDPESVLSRQSFQRDCVSCHQFANEFMRQPRDAEDWVPTVARMHAYVGNADEDIIARRSEMLAAAFQGDPISLRPEFPVDPEVVTAKIYEVPLEGVLFPHDAEVSKDDGLIYSVDRHGHAMLITDMATGETLRFDQPPTQREADENANGYTTRSEDPGPHSLALGRDSLWYTTNATADTIGVFDAEAREWKASYILPEPARYPHTLRIDKENIVWFTLAVSDQVGRVDPQTGDIDLINLPKVAPVGIAGGTSPYGIDVSPIDGKVWYARLFGDKIGFVDPETLEVTEYDSPVRGPRRLRFAANGDLWLTGFTDGMVARIKPDTMDMKVFTLLPEYSDGYRPAPYALGVHPETQEIWVNETMTDRVYRFYPEEERFIAYSMPLRGTYTRDFSFTTDGWACTANSPILNIALEDGVAGLICIDPDGSRPVATQ